MHVAAPEDHDRLTGSSYSNSNSSFASSSSSSAAGGGSGGGGGAEGGKGSRGGGRAAAVSAVSAVSKRSATDDSTRKPPVFSMKGLQADRTLPSYLLIGLLVAAVAVTISVGLSLHLLHPSHAIHVYSTQVVVWIGGLRDVLLNALMRLAGQVGAFFASMGAAIGSSTTSTSTSSYTSSSATASADATVAK